MNYCPPPYSYPQFWLFIGYLYAEPNISTLFWLILIIFHAKSAAKNAISEVNKLVMPESQFYNKPLSYALRASFGYSLVIIMLIAE